MTEVASALLLLQTLQSAYHTLQDLRPSAAWRYPTPCHLEDCDSFDYVIVGGGTAGCVLANRLSENYTVLLIEAGGIPPIESVFGGWFPLIPKSVYDYNYTSEDDAYTAQNFKNKAIALTQGKVLGGSSAVGYMLHDRPCSKDLDNWATISNNEGWKLENTEQYFKKIEKLTDPELLKSEYASLHGTDGPLEIKRETYPVVDNYLEALAELGHKTVLDRTSTESCDGYTMPLFENSGNLRQSSALAYISPIKSRSNLNLALYTTATKILIENQVAQGVQVTTSCGKSKSVFANKEVIVSAGAINSPKLMMLSGIGPKDHLESLNIELVIDLPVGKNFQDHENVVVGFQMEETNACTAAVNPHLFPAPAFTGTVTLNDELSYQTINAVFGPSSKELLLLCVNVLHYSDDICQKFFDSTKGRNTLFSSVSLSKPKSRGEVLLASCDPTTKPIVYTGTFTDSCDLTDLGKALLDHSRLLDTTYFKSVNASLIDTGLCKEMTTDEEFWQCYALAMAGTMGHYVGTCAMGSVVDSNLKVMGVESLRVVGSSVIPSQVTGGITAAVMMIAERTADHIICELNSSCD